MEERLSRKKFDAAFPAESIKKVLDVAGVAPEEVDRIAVGALCDAFDPNLAQDKEYRFDTALVSSAARFLPVALLESPTVVNGYRRIAAFLNQRSFFRRHSAFLRDLGFSCDKVTFYEHHSCHTATAYYGCPFRDDMLIFTSDGNGDAYCGTVSISDNEHWKRVVAIPSIHSLGGLYARATRFLGMKMWQDEYKVMGLAPWGARKRRAQEVYAKLRNAWQVEGLAYRNKVGFAADSMLHYLGRTLDYPRFDFAAHAVQRLLEDVLSEWVKRNVDHFGRRRLSFAGGVFYNIKANKRIAEAVRPDDLFVFPASGDESTCIGAAYLAYAELARERGHEVDLKPIGDVYWGEPIDQAIETTMAGLSGSEVKVERVDDIEDRIATLLANNEIVAVCDGRMEFGPRALGNRSILANPSDLENVERLNDSIKSRDFWMPFGLTMLDEEQDRYVENPLRLKSHYMIQAFETLPERRSEIAAGIHRADKSVRPQILERSFHPRFHRILTRFRDKTGIGAVVNTSLNLHGEPMVNLPCEALQLLERSGLKYLALGNYLVSKPT